VVLQVHRRVLEQEEGVASRKEQGMEHKMEQGQEQARMSVWVSHKHGQVVLHLGK